MHYSCSNMKRSASFVSHLFCKDKEFPNLNLKTLIKLTEILLEINDLNLVPCHVCQLSKFITSHVRTKSFFYSSTRVVLFFQ